MLLQVFQLIAIPSGCVQE